MARCMTKNPKSFDEGDNDRISNLPQGVIDLIIGFLPLREGARTCILSTKWRYVWAGQPSLILDKKFWADIKHRKKMSYKVTMVNKILLHHTGDVQKFMIDISIIPSERHNSDINLWLSLVCRRGVKELSFANSVPNEYTIPSCVFSAPTLTSLDISNSIINTKETSTCFSRLQNLTLYYVTLDSSVLNVPVLTSLSLKHCLGSRGFRIAAPKLESLILDANDDSNLNPYLICTNITVAYISSYKRIDNNVDTESVSLQKLLSSWPKLAQFTLDGSSLKYLTTGIVLENFSIVLKLTRFAPFGIDLDQTAWIFRIVGNSPLLQTFEISLGYNRDDLKASKYLKEGIVPKMNQLRTVKIKPFQGSTGELMLVEVLLHRSPSLKQMLLGEGYFRKAPSNKVLRLQRSFPKTEIIYC